MVDIPPTSSDLPRAPQFQIFPAIGIARVGDSQNYTYIAPESPDIDFVPEGGYRSPGTTASAPALGGVPLQLEQRIKRMGCRFRIYEFVQDDGLGERARPWREITLNEADIEWSVQLVNRKAGAAEDWGLGIGSTNALNGTHDPDLSIPPEYVIDTGEQTISGRNQPMLELAGEIMSGRPAVKPVKLGDIETDAEGRLIVYGGHGVADTWMRRAPDPVSIRNPGWYDDTSDGIVRATVHIYDDTFEALAARIAVGPPDYVHPCLAPVTLFDLAFDRSGGTQPETSFTEHIHPILHRATFLEWTLFKIIGGTWGRTPKHGHGLTANHDMHPDGAFFDPRVFPTLYDKTSAEGRRRREMYFSYLKVPDASVPPGGQGDHFSMPAIEGLTFTSVQHTHFGRLSVDNFDDDWLAGRDPADFGHVPFDEIAGTNRPAALNRAAMDFAVGGPFFPGVEVGAVAGEEATYVTVGNEDDDINFRVSDHVPAGALTQSLAVPWQVGMNQHNYQPATGDTADNLYPSFRPVVVVAKEHGTTDDFTWTRPFTNTRAADKFDRQKMRTNQQMIDMWSKLGFIAPSKSYVEIDRTLQEDPEHPI